MFKKDDYIVITKMRGTAASFSVNTIYKQREDYPYLRPYLDDEMGKRNGLSYIEYDNLSTWRYAKNYEIILYNIAKKPVKISDDLIKMIFYYLDKLEKKYEKI